MTEAEVSFREAITLKEEVESSAFTGSNESWNLLVARQLSQEVGLAHMNDWMMSLIQRLDLKKNQGKMTPADECFARALSLVKKDELGTNIDSLKQLLASTNGNIAAEDLHLANQLIAEYYCELRDYQKAAPFFDESIVAAEKAFGNNSLIVSNLLERKVLLSQLCKSKDCVIPELLRARNIRKTIYGDSDPAVADVEFLIGLTFRSISESGGEWAEKAASKWTTFLVPSPFEPGKTSEYYADLNRKMRESLNELEKRAISPQLSYQYSAASLLAISRLLAACGMQSAATGPANLSIPFIQKGASAEPDHAIKQIIAVARLLQDEGQFDVASQQLLYAYRSIKPKLYPWLEISLLRQLGELAVVQQDKLQARHFFYQGFQASHKMKKAETHDMVAVYLGLCELELESGDVAGASTQLSYAQQYAPRLSGQSPYRAQGDICWIRMKAKQLGSGGDEKTLEYLERLEQRIVRSQEPEVASKLAECLILQAAQFRQLNRLDEEQHALLKAYTLSLKVGGSLAEQRRCTVLSRLADNQSVQKNYSSSSTLARRCIESAGEYISKSWSRLSISELASFLKISELSIDTFLTHCKSESADLFLGSLQLTQWKGRLAEALRTQALALASSKDQSAVNLKSKLKQVNRELMSAYLKFDGGKDEQVLSQAARLTSLKEELQRGVKSLPSAWKPDPAFTDFRNYLDPSECFVDFYSYRNTLSGKPCLAAIVSAKAKFPVKIDFGDSKPIGEDLDDWLSAVGASGYHPGVRDSQLTWNSGLRDSLIVRAGRAIQTSRSEEECWASLSKKLLDKIQKAVPSGRKVIISPDGELARFPWTYAFLDSGKEVCLMESPRHMMLLRKRDSEHHVDSTALVIGDIEFGSPLVKKLPGTKEEIVALESKAGTEIQLTPLRGSEATKANVLESAQDKRYIHLATHGFFTISPFLSIEQLQSAEPGLSVERAKWRRFVASFIRERNPFFESGLILASDHSDSLTENDGIATLTADELLGVDLSGCELVTLSACQTGLGRVDTGQGVLGLRTAITTAGARSLLMSLWKVDDDATKELMKEFYMRVWQQKMPKAQALAEAQRVIRKKWKSPRFWAAWVLSGEGW